MIDEYIYTLMDNGNKLKLYKKPISKDEFTAKLQT